MSKSEKHLTKCPFGIGEIVRMIDSIDGRPNRYWNNKRDFETYTVIGALRQTDAQSGWMICAMSETGRQNPWLDSGWYRRPQP